MFYTKLQTFSQTEINNKLADKKQVSITLTSSLTLSAITLTGSMIGNKIIASYYEPTTGGTFMNFNISSTAVMALTATLIRLMQPVQIDQGCKIQNNLSLGSYSSTNPNLWIETTSIQSGSITTSNNITAGVNIYATDGLIKAKNLEITTTSTFTGNISAPNIYTKTDVDGLLAVKVSSADISTALADKQDKITLSSSLTLSSITLTGTMTCKQGRRTLC